MNAHRRAVILVGTSALTLPAWLHAQPTGKVWRVGVLLHTIVFERFRLRAAIGDVGLEEGRNLLWEVRSSQGQAERLDALAAELVAARVDAIVAPTNLEIQAVMRATRSTPIVMVYATAPVELGMIASLARPGGNVTGTTTNVPEMAGKMVEVLRDVLPRMTHMAYLYEPDYPGISLYQRASERAAAALGLKLDAVPVRKPADLDDALAVLERLHPQALLVSMTGPVMGGFRRVVQFAAAQRLPAVYSAPSPVAEGGLMAYSFDPLALMRRTAMALDKVLKGARPADIPVEEPAEFQLALNLKTAAALGLTFPPAVLMRATAVVQ